MQILQLFYSFGPLSNSDVNVVTVLSACNGMDDRHLARENGNAEILQLMLHPPRKDPPPIKDGGKYAL